MDSTEYIGPAGQRQTVDSVVAATRLRSRGWVPRSELEKLAAFRPAAAEQLRLADEAAAERERRIQQRQAMTAPGNAARGVRASAPVPDEGSQTSEPDSQAPGSPRKRSSKT